MKYNKIFLYFLFILLLFTSCNDIVKVGDESVKREIESEKYIVKKNKILQNDEPFSIFTNSSLRSFKVNEPLQIKINSPTTFLLTSYSLYTINNVEIWANIPTLNDEVCIMKIENVTSLSQNEYSIPLCLGDGRYKTRSGKYIYIEKITEGFNSTSLTLSVDSEDVFYKKIKEIKCNWKITFGGFTPASQNTQNWTLMNPLYCRAYIALMTNFAYVFSSEEFEILFTKYYSEIKGNANSNLTLEQRGFKVNGSTYFTKEEQYTSLINSIRNKAQLNCGLTGIYEGLGGGSSYGIHPHYFNWHYYNVEQAGVCAIVHEFGHCMGYGHDSDFCYGYFEKPFLQYIWQMLIKLERMPYSEPPDECNMFSIENEGLRYDNGRAIRNYKNLPWGSNPIEIFVKNHPEDFVRANKEIEALSLRQNNVK